ncbi:MAG: glycosyltransferase [Cyclobacteriaceae bacterium]|nr:glycosyltransferase [Cyclobacteriaceae bacterium]
MNKPAVSIIIAFYNRMDFLQLVLAGFERQNFIDFEIVLADDGSNEGVVQQLRTYISQSPLKIRHVWHEDHGWRKTKILNKAVLAAEADYLILIDGDCIPHPAFVREHYENRQAKTILAGRRVHLSKKFSVQLTPENIRKGKLDHWLALLWDSLIGDSKNVEKALYLKSKWLRRFANRKPKDLLGCNLSFHKEDLLALNGYDERYVNPGTGEDTDLYVRSLHIGYTIKPILNMAIQYHLHHKKGERSKMHENGKILLQTKADKLIYTPYGIHQTKI